MIKESKKQLRDLLYVSLAMVIILSSVISAIIVSTPINSSYGKSINITYSDSVNKEEISCVENIINQVKPIYLTKIKSIFVTKLPKEMARDDLLGYNDHDNIQIWFPPEESSYDSVSVVSTLCHELLHSYIVAPDDDEEEMIQDMTLYSKPPCYGDKIIWRC